MVYAKEPFGGPVGRVLIEPAVDPAPIKIIQRQPFAQRLDILTPIRNGFDVVGFQFVLDVLQ